MAGCRRTGPATRRLRRRAHATLDSGDLCPECRRGKVYRQKEPATLVRFVGHAPLEATVFEMERLRCNACGQVFTADAPATAGPDKYDATAVAMIALMKYGTGVPFNRLERLEQQLGMPVSAATQWELLEAAGQRIRPALEEFIRQAAQGGVLHNDDTGMRILRLAREPGDKRTGTFTSGIVSMVGVWRIALFFTGWKHAGENLGEVLKQRARELPAPIQMCDALSRNTPKLEGAKTLANCIAHGRRQFVEVVDNFPEECRYVLETLRGVYHHDALAREQELTAEDRLGFHQEHSGPLMKGLHAWMEAQLAEHKTEPNSGLGKAISYLLNHWPKLTLFLQQPGAPLDNNIAERALKKAILNRKNALFYKTLNGAGVGDLFMSLIHTCELNGANPFDYLTELQRHAEELKGNPAEWMPWNYSETLARLATPAAA
ncbi:MAG: IS66 family transposase [Bryobacteraceae bacterium]